MNQSLTSRQLTQMKVMLKRMKTKTLLILNILCFSINILFARDIHYSYFLRRKVFLKFSLMSFLFCFFKYLNFLEIQVLEWVTTQWEQIVLQIIFISMSFTQTKSSLILNNSQLSLLKKLYSSDLICNINLQKKLTCTSVA